MLKVVLVAFLRVSVSYSVSPFIAHFASLLAAIALLTKRLGFLIPIACKSLIVINHCLYFILSLSLTAT